MKSKKELSVYIHIPFCKSKCFYCDFISFAKKESEFSNYTEAIIKEIKAFDFSEYNIKTIFLGGGTPTVLPPIFLYKILKSLPINSSNIEVTIEANPGTINLDMLKILKEAGVNRFSLGLQAWQDKLLKKLGRVHTQKEFLEAYENILSMGFNNINVDLMFALPEQTISDLEESLKAVLGLSPTHISLYSLILEEGTKFYEMYSEINEELDRKMYESSIQILNENGYNRYEISNFSKEAYECLHNIAYWERREYIGFGLAAHSFIDGSRFSNTESYKKYIINPTTAKENILEISKKDSMEEFMFLGLRMSKGISISEFENSFGTSIFDIYASQLKKFQNHNLIDIRNGRIFLSQKGINLSNIIFSEFLL